MKYKFLTIILTTLCVVGWFSLGAMGQTPRARVNKRAGQVRITLARARAIALRRAPGRVESGELEREAGQIVYSFDIRNRRGTISEVWVNAATGRIVKVAEENARQEAAEKRADERAERQRRRIARPRKP
jgi:signal transduction histidine kinase